MYRKLALFIFLIACTPLFAQTANINGSTTLQTIDGFGGENGGCWSWASSPVDWNNMTTAQANLFFSQTPGVGVGLSIYRTDNCDGNPPSTSTFPDITAMQTAQSLGAQIEVRLQSPPSALKYSGSFPNGTANPSTGSCVNSNSAYSTYIIQALQVLTANGITPNYLDLEGEPNGVGNTNVNGFGACNINAAGLASLLDALGPVLASNGFGSVKVMMPSVYPTSSASSYYGACLADSSCKTFVSVLSSDGYGFPDSPSSFATGYHWWMGETSDNNATSFNAGMNDTGTGSGALTSARNIAAFLNAGFSSWNYWELGYITQGGDCENCNLVGVSSAGVSTTADRLWVMGNWSQFCRPGSVLISATYNPQSNIFINACKNTSTGQFAIIAVNENSGSTSQTFALTSLSAPNVTPYVTSSSGGLVKGSAITISGSSFTASLAGYSVTTFVGNTSGTPAATPVFSPVPGTYTSTQTVTITDSTPSSTIHYTLDGSQPTTGSPTYSSSLTVSATETVLAIAVASGFTQSANGGGLYTIASGGTINAASCNFSDVQTALNAVTASTTLLIIPNGTCTWTSSLSWSVPSGSTGLVIQGQTTCTGDGSPYAGSNLACTDNTTVVDGLSLGGGDPALFAVTTLAGAPFRMTGLTFQGSGAVQTYNGALNIYGGSTQVRVDHNHFVNLNQATLNAGAGISGVFDHNVFQQASPSVLFHTTGATSADQFGQVPWSQPTSLGTSNFVFFEDNIVLGGSDDCDRGGRFVMRFNTFTAESGTAQFWLTHPTGEPGGAIRGCRAWEAYGNKLVVPSGLFIFSAWFLSSGTGVDWGNTASVAGGGGLDNWFSLLSVLSRNVPYTQVATPNGWGYCGTNFCTANPTNSGCSSGASTPSSVWSQNTSTATGYRCLDQPGTGQGQLLTGNFPTLINSATGTPIWPTQASEPIYSWMDTYTPGTWINNETPTVLIQNSDFYLWCNAASTNGCTSFTGATGVGSGTRASRSSTCTTGVAYFSTDQGTWNTSGNGFGQGVLDKCTGTNTWTNAVYTPYTYPHPLDNSTPSTAVPTFSPVPGTYTSTQTVTISDATPSSTIYYTTNGSTPTTSSSVYSTPLTVSSTETILAIATASGFLNSAVGGGTYTIGSARAATPVVTPASGTYPGSVTVSISDSTGGSTIYYTTNGTTPTTSSTVYSGPFTITATSNVLAIATAAGFSQSAVGAASYTIINAPIVLDASSTFSGGATSLASASCPSITPTAGDGIVVQIVYGGNATVTSVKDNVNSGNYSVANAAYYGPNPLGSSVAIYFKSAVAGSPTVITFTPSVSSQFIGMACQAWKGFSGAGAFTFDSAFSQQNPVSSGFATGANPTTGSAKTPTNANELIIGLLVAETQTPTVGAGYTALEALPADGGFSEYQVQTTATATNTPWVMASDDYVAQMSAFYFPGSSPTAATPTFSPTAGTYTSAQTVTISSTTSGAGIYYTTDGTTPTTSSTLYSSPVTVSSTEVINAIAVKSGFINSSLGTASYIINLPAAATPSPSPSPGTYTGTQVVSFTDSTGGASIFCTTNGNTPTPASNPYTGAFTVTSTQTLQCIATASGFSQSAVGGGTYFISVPTPPLVINATITGGTLP